LSPDSISLFESLRERSLLELELTKAAGKQVVGLYCVFAPKELIRAAGAIPVGLCGKNQNSIRDAEAVLPANLCPLIKSSYGYAITETCPYLDAADLVIGETTCDGKKKMFELLREIKPLFLMHLPPTSEGEGALNYWIEEVIRLKGFLETQTQTRITDEELSRQIEIHNEERRLLKAVLGLCKDDPVPISGLDMMTVMETKSFTVNLDDYGRALQQLFNELEIMKSEGKSVVRPETPRILLTGCPVGKGSEKVVRLIEECGGIVVCQENCSGIKGFDLLVDEKDDGDPYRAIAQRYLMTPCSCMTPNPGRINLIGRLVADFKIRGVVDLTWHCCHTYNIESHFIREFLSKEHGIPMLHIETDYSASDTGQLKTRIEAFLEMLH
jgi:benzoyl-CoA reductase/2-hydroxyglutaryl-CoA dehydratase subunit BcrC/BadD/HgdB